MGPTSDPDAPLILDAMHHLSLSVTDLDRSAAWYEDLFGLERVMTEEAGDRSAIVYRFPRSRLMFGLVQHDGTSPTSFDPCVTGLDHAAFTVATRAELDAWVARLDARRIVHSGVIEIPPGAILNFRDPDDIQLALFWDREH
jgi:catechol 2,3-dioxygenase-like lactoylglutathione lyase family enzyme